MGLGGELEGLGQGLDQGPTTTPGPTAASGPTAAPGPTPATTSTSTSSQTCCHSIPPDHTMQGTPERALGGLCGWGEESPPHATLAERAPTEHARVDPPPQRVIEVAPACDPQPLEQRPC